MKKETAIILRLALILMLTPFPALAQETQGGDPPEDQAESPAEEELPAEKELPAEERLEIPDGTYVVQDITLTLDGRTDAFFLLQALDLKEGELICGPEALRTWLADKRQLLVNQRPLTESSSLSVTWLTLPETGPSAHPEADYALTVHIYAQDSWNLMVLPYFKFDSNSGLQLSLKGRNYNFFGTLEKALLNLDYTYDVTNKDNPHGFDSQLAFELPYVLPNGETLLWDQTFQYNYDADGDYKHTLGGEMGLTLPFYLGPQKLEATEKLSVTVPFGGLARQERPSQLAQVTSISGLALVLPWVGQDWRLAYRQGYHLNEGGDDDEDGYFYSSDVSWGTGITTPVYLGCLGQLVYAPAVGTRVNYKPYKQMSEDRRGVVSYFRQTFKADGRLDWLGNFRDGQKISISPVVDYSYFKRTVSSTVSGEAQFHRALGFAGFSSRLLGKYYWGKDPMNNMGGPLRGILDTRIDDVDAAAYLNLDFPVKLWIWFMANWFEGHLGPFVDVAIVRPANRTYDVSKDVWVSGGLEGFAFAKFSRSLYLRGSLGVDLRAVHADHKPTGGTPRDGQSRLELFIGLGHHYE